MANEIGSATFGLVVGLGRFKRGLADAEQEAKKSGDKVGDEFTEESTDKVGASGSRWASALESLKPALIGAGAALGAATVIGMLDGIERERLGDRLAAQLNLDPAQAETAGQIAGDVYASAWGDSLAEVHDAVGAVMSTLGDLDPDSIETATIRALALADTFAIDVSRAISSVGILMNSGLAADADQAFDLITRSMQEMPAHMREELLEASDEYSQFFAQLGISGEDAFGILVAASADGMYGIDKTGDALKELTIRATDMSAASVAAYQAAGLNAEDMAARFAAGGDTAGAAFDELIDGLLSIEDPVARANASIALFGTPLEDLGVAEIPDFLRSLDTMETSLGDVAGATDEVADTLSDNASTEFEAFKREALQGLGEFAEDYAIPALRRLGDFVGDTLVPAVSGFTDWVRDNRGVAVGLAVAIGTILVGAFILLAIAAWAAAIPILAMLAPFIAVGVAAGALAYLIVTHWETIKNATTTAKDWIVDRWNDVVGFITGLPGRITSAASGMWDGIKDAFADTFRAIIRWWNDLRFPEFTLPTLDLGILGTYGGGTIGGWNLPDIHLAGLAAGGTTTSSGLVMVGERGPEVLSLPTGATVTPLERIHADDGDDGDDRPILIYLDGKLVYEVVRDRDTDRARRNGRAA